jgi:ssDNA-binding Zn-finger/Zn-ribbon topoisomerase 1
MLLFKSCPKCKGDVELGSDMDGDFVKCLMCGLSRYMPEASRAASREPRPAEQAVELPRAS